MIQTIEKFNDSEFKIKIGVIASGDIFCTDPRMKDKIRYKFDADAIEMEGAAIAHAATLNNIPFVIIRAISDKADNSAQMDYPEFERAAAIHSANLVLDYVTRL